MRTMRRAAGTGLLLAAVLSSACATEAEISSFALERAGRRCIDMIASRLTHAHRDSLIPDVEAPLLTTSLDFRSPLGVSQQGMMEWSSPERIELDSEAGTGCRVLLVSDPDTQNERRIVLCEHVSTFLEDELPNGQDDNGNGLVDEPGFSFVLSGNFVTVRLSLASGDYKSTFVSRVLVRGQL